MPVQDDVDEARGRPPRATSTALPTRRTQGEYNAAWSRHGHG
jgi:hypothetical protein